MHVCGLCSTCTHFRAQMSMSIGRWKPSHTLTHLAKWHARSWLRPLTCRHSGECVCRFWEMMRISSAKWVGNGACLCGLWLCCNSCFHCGRPCIAQTLKGHTLSVQIIFCFTAHTQIHTHIYRNANFVFFHYTLPSCSGGLTWDFDLILCEIVNIHTYTDIPVKG